MVRLAISLMYLLFTVCCRLGLGIPNFSPLLAFSLFAGACLPNRYLAYFLPLGVLLATDLYLGIHATMFFTYLSIFLISLLGVQLSAAHPIWGWKRIGLGAIGSSLLFFLITNFGVWALTSLYSPDWKGLVACFTAGLPFYRSTLTSTALFSYLFFFGYARGVAWVQDHHHRGSAIHSR